MSRVQLALNVSDLDEAVAFYTKLFRTGPAKVRDGYANFAIAEPPLKLVLFENPGQAGTLNHLGVEVDGTADVVAATRRLAAEGLSTEVKDGVSCCYSLQDKVWVSGADTRWEFYTVIADAPQACSDGGCCAVQEPVHMSLAGNADTLQRERAVIRWFSYDTRQRTTGHDAGRR